MSGQVVALIVDVEGDGVSGYGDYPEGAIGNWRKLVPFLRFRVVIILTDEIVISFFFILARRLRRKWASMSRLYTAWAFFIADRAIGTNPGIQFLHFRR